MREARIFDTYQEFYSLTRPLNESQREALFNSLCSSERRRLSRALKSEGWGDLIARNQVDRVVDQIKEDFNEDLVLIRIEVLHGNIRKVRKAFWEYVNDVLADYSLRHKWHVLEGIATKQHSDEWVLLVPSKRRNIENGKKESG
tara:strand:+ start:286085 stop:286516 length:432 start_codon:yes stop_codon:yes gene_type:complete